MSNNVIVYVSADCGYCDKLMADMDKLGIDYDTKNVTKNPEYMKELQSRGVYGTPATLIRDKNEIISGMQIKKIKHMLGLTNSFSSFKGSFG